MLGGKNLAFLCVGVGVKLLLWPAYHSTDFEVHRNWLAITSSLPLSKWYFEDGSEWTLDYPPFFAWFEWVLSLAARWWDPRIVQLDNLGYAASSCVEFQRLTVIVSEVVLFTALGRFVRASGGTRQSKIAAALTFLSAGFLFVDHVHFQYNGFLFGILVYSLAFAMEGHDLLAGTTFAVLLCFKHIFMYIAPAYFIYLAINYCAVLRSRRRSQVGGCALDIGASVWRLAKLGTAVVVVFAVAFGPFAAKGQLPQLASRLFPFKRGLCHAYWAPNFWALYVFADRLLILASRFMPALGLASADLSGMAASTRGLVGDTSFAVLPDIPPIATFIATLLAQIPAYVVLIRKGSKKRRGPQRLIQSVVLCAYASYMFGWHVHEKAILLILVPLGLLTVAPTQRTLRMFAVLSTAGYYSLFPLLFGAQELLIKAAVLLIWVLCALALLKSDRGVSAWSCLLRAERLYVLGHIPLFVATELLPGYAFGRLQFLPLALVSVYTAFGVTYSWLGLVYEFALHHSHSTHKRH